MTGLGAAGPAAEVLLTRGSLPALCDGRASRGQAAGGADQYQFIACEWPHAEHGVPYEREM